MIQTSSSLHLLSDQAVFRRNGDVTRWVSGDLLQERLRLQQLIGPVLTRLLYTRPLPSVLWRQDMRREEVAQSVVEISTVHVDLQ